MKKRLQNIILNFKNKIKPVQVYALVGRSGTGKSFRARLVAEEYGIELIFDDGLLIRDQVIIAGKSAKREKNRFKAVKRAILTDPEHAEEIRTALRAQDIHSILLLGTSEKMIARITEKLDLPYPDKIIYIDDIATQEEIATATESRKQRGHHVIPVPTIELENDSHKIIDSVKIFLNSHKILFWKKKVVEKTIVQPKFSTKGRLSISETALSQMVMHCIDEFNDNFKIKKIRIKRYPADFRIDLSISVPFGTSVPSVLPKLQRYIVTSIQKYSGITIENLHITIEEFQS
ncbi:Asp23/Gls24 family envelope stress response protein [bacterium]|nr:Asp23/Gls24 family envelope stress response protein [bacterium]